MKQDSAVVTIKGVMPTSNGCAIFLGNEEKTFVIYVDPAIGNAVNMTLNKVKKERPSDSRFNRLNSQRARNQN